MNIKKYWFETLMSIAAAFGVVGVVIYINLTAITLWLHANWIWIAVAVVLGTARWWFVPLVVALWRAYKAISDHLHTREMQFLHRQMLVGANAKLEQGFETVYKNEV